MIFEAAAPEAGPAPYILEPAPLIADPMLAWALGADVVVPVGA